MRPAQRKGLPPTALSRKLLISSEHLHWANIFLHRSLSPTYRFIEHGPHLDSDSCCLQFESRFRGWRAGWWVLVDIMHTHPLPALPSTSERGWVAGV